MSSGESLRLVMTFSFYGRRSGLWVLFSFVVLMTGAKASTWGPPRGGAATKAALTPFLNDERITREDASVHVRTPPTTFWFQVKPLTRTSESLRTGTEDPFPLIESESPVVEVIPSSMSLITVQRQVERLYHWYHTSVPSLVRYMVSGNLGNVCLIVLESMLRFHLPIPKPLASFSFLLAYILHIPLQHYLHALLVYGMETINTTKKYRKTLLGLYSTLALSGVGTTLLHSYLQSLSFLRHIPKSTQLLGTLYAFAVVNYLALTYLVNPQ